MFNVEELDDADGVVFLQKEVSYGAVSLEHTSKFLLGNGPGNVFDQNRYLGTDGLLDALRESLEVHPVLVEEKFCLVQQLFLDEGLHQCWILHLGIEHFFLAHPQVLGHLLQYGVRVQEGAVPGVALVDALEKSLLLDLLER